MPLSPKDGKTLMLRCGLLLLVTSSVQAATPGAPEAVSSALAACAAMQERFKDTECATSRTSAGSYRVTIKAATPDAMRVVFMRSLDVADLLCGAGHKVELAQELETSEGTRLVRWHLNPPDCGIERK
jgi:outer membrane lipoprotein-sorting protein